MLLQTWIYEAGVHAAESSILEERITMARGLKGKKRCCGVGTILVMSMTKNTVHCGWVEDRVPHVVVEMTKVEPMVRCSCLTRTHNSSPAALLRHPSIWSERGVREWFSRVVQLCWHQASYTACPWATSTSWGMEKWEREWILCVLSVTCYQCHNLVVLGLSRWVVTLFI